MKKQIVMLSLVAFRQLRYSARGNPRWEFLGIADDGRTLAFKTAGNASSAYSCNMNGLYPNDRLMVSFHETPSGQLVADHWDNSRSAGMNLRQVVAVFTDDELRNAKKNADGNSVLTYTVPSAQAVANAAAAIGNTGRI